MKIQQSKNFFVPIIEMNGEYYLVDFVPKWWEMFFGFWRVALFWYPAKKIEYCELIKYQSDKKKNTKVVKPVLGPIGMYALGQLITHNLNKFSFHFSILSFVIVMVIVHLICFILYTYYLDRHKCTRLKKTKYKAKYKVYTRPFLQFTIYVLMMVFVLWLQGQQILIPLNYYNNGYSLENAFFAISSVLFWWCNIIHFIPDKYGEIVVSKIEE